MADFTEEESALVPIGDSEYGIRFTVAKIDMGTKDADPLEKMHFVDEESDIDESHGSPVRPAYAASPARSQTGDSKKNDMLASSLTQPSPYKENMIHLSLNPPMELDRETGKMVKKGAYTDDDVRRVTQKLKNLLMLQDEPLE